MLLAVVDELGGGVPFHGELALADGERARLERNLVVGVGTVGLRRRHGVAALAHGLAALAGDGDVLEGLALDELALGDLPAQSGINVAVRLGSIGCRHGDLARRHHKLGLALDSSSVDGRAVLERQGADVLDLGDRSRPSDATVDAVRDRRALGQGRGIGSVDLAVILAGVAGNRGCRDYNLLGGVVVTDSAAQMLGSRLLERRLLVDYPLEGMLGNVNPLTTGANMPVRRTIALPAGANGLVLGDALDGNLRVFLNLGELVNTLLAGLDGLAVCLNSKILGRVIAVRDRKHKRRRTVPVELSRISRERVARLLGRQRHLEPGPSGDRNGNGLGGFVIRRLPVAQAIGTGRQILKLVTIDQIACLDEHHLFARLAQHHRRIDALNLAVMFAAHGLRRHLCIGGAVPFGLGNSVRAFNARRGLPIISKNCVLTNKIAHIRRIRASIYLCGVNYLQRHVVAVNQISYLCRGALLLAVVNVLTNIPRHIDSATRNSELARLKRNVVVSVGALFLRSGHLVRRIADQDILALIALVRDAGKRIALHKGAGRHFIGKVGVRVAIRFRCRGRSHRDRARRYLERHLSLDVGSTRGCHLIVDRGLADIFDCGSIRFPRGATVDAELSRRAILKVHAHGMLFAVIHADITADARRRNLLLAQDIAARGALIPL